MSGDKLLAFVIWKGVWKDCKGMLLTIISTQQHQICSKAQEFFGLKCKQAVGQRSGSALFEWQGRILITGLIFIFSVCKGGQCQ
jgi:hypothetical protein